jgi:hypothetical protein
VANELTKAAAVLLVILNLTPHDHATNFILAYRYILMCNIFTLSQNAPPERAISATVTRPSYVRPFQPLQAGAEKIESMDKILACPDNHTHRNHTHTLPQPN